MVQLSSLLSLSALVALAGSTDAAIDRGLLNTYKTKSTANVFVVLKDGTATARRMAVKSASATRGENIAAMRNSLKHQATKSQKSVFDKISSKPGVYNVKSKSFWVSNEVYIEGATLDLVEELQSLDEVAEVYEEEIIPLLTPMDVGDIEPRSDDNQWGIQAVRAPEVWDTGCRGAGVKIGSIDTGAQWDHDALIDTYAGLDDPENYAWLNPHNTSQKLPEDPNGHGTHTIGTMVGQFGYGVAPEAEWIACQGCSYFGCSQSSLKSCGEFMLCPHATDDDTQANCDLAPQIVSNSWGGGQGRTWYDPVIDAWRDADIIPVFAMGNSGRGGCGTANSPGDNPNVIGVGATDINNQVTDFSSRGPPVNDQDMIKPEVVAPGAAVKSAWPSKFSTDMYRAISGTSMACPHVSGIIALILSEKPDATYDDVLEMLTSTAMTSDLVEDKYVCGNIDSKEFPNYVYGSGLTDVYECIAQS